MSRFTFFSVISLLFTIWITSIAYGHHVEDPQICIISSRHAHGSIYHTHNVNLHEPSHSHSNADPHSEISFQDHSKSGGRATPFTFPPPQQQSQQQQQQSQEGDTGRQPPPSQQQQQSEQQQSQEGDTGRQPPPSQQQQQTEERESPPPRRDNIDTQYVYTPVPEQPTTDPYIYSDDVYVTDDFSTQETTTTEYPTPQDDGKIIETPVYTHVVEPLKPPEITITHLVEHSNPYAIYVYVQNHTKRHIPLAAWKLHIIDSEGNLKHNIPFSRQYFTYQGVNCKKNAEYQNENGVCANNKFAVASPRAIKQWDFRNNRVKFLLRAPHNFHRHPHRYNPDTDTIKIIFKDTEQTVVAAYPEPAAESVAGAPALHRQAKSMTTAWGQIKMAK